MSVSWRNSLMVVVLTAVTAALGWALRFPEATIPPFWPSTGFLFAILVVTTRAEWLRLMVAAAGPQYLVDQLMAPAGAGIQAAIISTLVLFNGYLAARIVLSFLNKPRRRSVASEIMAYSVVGALVAPGACAVLAVLLLGPWLSADGTFPALLLWWSGSFVGIALVAPLFVTIGMMRGTPVTAGRATTREILAALSTLLMLAILFLGPMATPLTEVIGAPVSFAVFAILPALLWVAMRLDPRLVAGIATVVFVIAAGYASDGLGPFAVTRDAWHATYGEMQLYFFAVCSGALILAWSIYERRNVVDLLRSRVGIGELVVAMFNRFATTPFDRLDDVVNETLRDVGEFAVADRVWLMRFDTARGRLVVPNHWAREGVAAHADRLDGLPLRNVQWAVDRLSQGQQLLLLRRDPPRGAESVVAVMEAAETLVAGFVPLVEDGEVIGAMGFDWVRTERYWSDEIVALLYIVGQLFVGALRRERNQRLETQYQKRLRDLATGLAITEERARRETAVDLHDGIGQNLAVARIKLSLLEKELGKDHKTLGTLNSLMDTAMQQTRSLVSGLSPSVLYELGLIPALRSLANSMSDRWDVRIGLRELGDSQPVPEEPRIALYRSVRELLTNTVKHARASEAGVVVEWREDGIIITVDDNGVGFTPPDNESDSSGGSGFGLFSIRERMLSHGGSVNIDSRPGSGTRVRLSLPLAAESAPA